VSRRLSVALIVVVTASACGQGVDPGFTNAPAVDQIDDAALSRLVANNTAFALELLNVLAEDEGNVLIGPASISEGLAMPYLGARSDTAEQMAEVLHYGLGPETLHRGFATLRSRLISRANDALELAMANRVFGQERFGFLDSYLADLSRYYESPLGTIDFDGDPEEARQQINDWTSEQTAERIPELFPPGSIDPLTRLILVNATYLTADWYFPFNPANTKPAPFTRPDGSQVTVDMMNFNEHLPSGSGQDWQAVTIPYSGEQLSMLVIVPTDLEKFLAAFDATNLAEIREAITEGGIHLHFPKLELREHTDLIPPLEQLGLTMPFEVDADFSGMTGTPGLFIDSIEHETYIKVDEVGTEAAAATGSSMLASHGPTVVVDRPFLFLIFDGPTGAILFLGLVTDPLA